MNGNSNGNADSQHRQIIYQHQQQHHQQQYTPPHLIAKKLKPKRSRDSSCCSINFIKYVLQIFNIIFFVSIQICIPFFISSFQRVEAFEVAAKTLSICRAQWHKAAV